MNLLHYPDLPLKDPTTCLEFLSTTGLRRASIAELTGYSTTAVWRWYKYPDTLTLPAVDAVNELAYRVAWAWRQKLPVVYREIESLRRHLLERHGQPFLAMCDPDIFKRVPPYTPSKKATDELARPA